MSRIGRRLCAAAVGTILVAAQLAGHAAGSPLLAPRLQRSVKIIAPGLTFTKIVDKLAPRRIFVLTVDISQPLAMDVALAQDKFPGFETTSSMAARGGAIAAVNGDFGGFQGRPTHPFAEDGDLKNTSSIPGVSFAVSADEQSIFMAAPKQSVTAVQAATGETWNVDRWNDGPPGLGEIAGYTAVGGTLDPPPAYACSVRLFPDGGPQLQSPAPGVATDYTVDQTACSATPMTTNGGIVLSALPSTDEAQQLLSLSTGESVHVTWSFGWPGVLSAIGGVPLLVSNGQVVATNCTTSFCLRNPRTGVGVTTDGKLLLVVVDGRQAKYSVGYSLVGFARLFQQLGAVTAMNMDGGGSSTMVINGKIVNRPSGGFERKVSSALLVLPGPKTGTLFARAAPAASPAARGASWRRAWRLAELDPGSTGGMLDALAAGALGASGYRLPARFLAVVRRFRSHG